MAANLECVCSRDVEKTLDKMQESDAEIGCITDHEGFEAVCLNRWVLQAAYFSYRHHCGGDDRPIHE